MHNDSYTSKEIYLENPPDSAGSVESKLGMVVIDDHMSVVSNAHLGRHACMHGSFIDLSTP